MRDTFAFTDTLDILRHLRNTVHGKGIQAAMRQSGPNRDAPIILPSARESQILASMGNLGGRDAWGAGPGAGGMVTVNPGQFVEQLLPAVIRLLNAVMAATPSDDAGSPGAPADADHPWWGERNRLSVSWQLGF